MHWILWVIVGLVCALIGAIGVVILVGVALPQGHSATSRITIDAPAQAVWDALTDYQTMPQWRPELTKVEPFTSDTGAHGWIEHTRHGAMPLVIESAEPPRLLVGRIADDTLPFGGAWTYQLTPDGEGTTVVSITEDGEVYNPIFRFVSRLVMGHHRTMEMYLKNLGRKFGAEVHPERIRT
jgi:uncharacterized protein YndB with AHSA1/START domain